MSCLQEIIPHPYFARATKKNDIALLRLVKPIRFSARTHPACLETNLNDVDPTISLTAISVYWGIGSIEIDFN